MAAKRVKRARRWPGLKSQASGTERPTTVTCPACGASAQLFEHCCPHCGQLFHERPEGGVGRGPRSAPARDEPEIAEFARCMDRVEGWTRVACIIGGMLFGLLALACAVTLGAGIGLRGTVLFGLLSVVCFLRGLKGAGADTRFLSSLPRIRPPFR